MKAMIGTPASGGEMRKRIIAAARAVGIDIANTDRDHPTHFVTPFPNSAQSQLLKQQGVKVITFKEFGEVIKVWANNPNKAKVDKARIIAERRNALRDQRAQQVAEIARAQAHRLAVQPVATEEPEPEPMTAENVIKDGKRKLDI